MPFAFLLALAAIAGATMLTYVYERDALFLSRLCAGVCIGFAALGLVGFVLASLLGMTTIVLVLSGLIVASPLALLWNVERRERLKADVAESVRVMRQAIARPRKGATGTLIFHIGAALLFWYVFDRAMYENAGGIFTGVDTNIGDLPFHLAVISGFTSGQNFPPQHPEFAGVRLTYPFIVDFVTALFVRAGASLQGALFWQNYAMIMSLVGLLHRFALKLTRDAVAALVTPALVLLSGGIGWYVFLAEGWTDERGFFSLLGGLEHDYTIMGHLGYRWGNAVTALFVTQRSILLGVALALVVWTLWWKASEGEEGKWGKGERDENDAALLVESRSIGKKGAGKKKFKDKNKAARVRAARETDETVSNEADNSFAFCLSPFALREMIAAGAIAGLLPLVHAHSFVVMMLMGACLALLQGVLLLAWNGGATDKAREATEDGSSVSVWAKLWTVWRPWIVFAFVASLLAVPQMFWATRDSGVRAGQFFGWEFGWDHDTENVLWFWLKNTGVFFPLLFVALAWRGREQLVTRRLLFFYLPFTLCFIVPNVYKLSPWIWDNIKILLYWWIASAPLVALVLARLWRRGAGWRALAVALLLMQTASGALDVWRAASGAVERRSYDKDGIAFSEVIRRETAPRSLILHAPTYNDPVYLTGRRSFLGFTGHVWSHGIDYASREAALKTIYAGGPNAAAIIAREKIEYVVVGPLERDELKKSNIAVNEAFFRQFKKVGETGEYRLFKTQP
jgi:hypothetical protein